MILGFWKCVIHVVSQIIKTISLLVINDVFSIFVLYSPYLIRLRLIKKESFLIFISFFEAKWEIAHSWKKEENLGVSQWLMEMTSFLTFENNKALNGFKEIWTTFLILSGGKMDNVDLDNKLMISSCYCAHI